MAMVDSLTNTDKAISIFLERQDVVFERGLPCGCGEHKYRVLRDNVVVGELCPKCDGQTKLKQFLQ